jgi:hypothetical protein
MDKELLKNKVRYLYNKWLNQKAKEIFITKINKYSKIIKSASTPNSNSKEFEK